MHMVRQQFFDLCMKTHTVTDMGEIRLFRPDFGDKGQSFFQVKMGMVWFFSQCIHYKHFKSFQVSHFLRINSLDVRQVGKVFDPVPEYLEAVMARINRSDPELPQWKGFSLLYPVHRHCRGPGIPVLIRKDVIETLVQGGHYPIMCINGDVPLPEEKWTDIVDACGVVGMLMGKEYGVQPVYGVAEHLLTEIRAAIDDNVMTVHLHQYGYSQAFVPGIFA